MRKQSRAEDPISPIPCGGPYDSWRLAQTGSIIGMIVRFVRVRVAAVRL